MYPLSVKYIRLSHNKMLLRETASEQLPERATELVISELISGISACIS